MANIHINRGGTSLGVFPEEEVREGLRTARFLGTDLGWREGMASWQPLSQFSEFATATSTPASSDATPPSTPAVLATSTAPPIAREGLPWDHRQELGFFNAFIETLKLVLLQPDNAFSRMKTEGGLAEPLIYAAVGGGVGLIISIFWNLLFSSVGSLGNRNPLGQMIGAGFGTVFTIILGPIILLLCLFVGAAIIHLCLMLVGGANRSFETTFRVICFAVGSTNPIMIVPICGGLIACVWNIVVECIGLARAHETTTGRAVLAVFLPLILCCGALVAFGLIFGVGLSQLMNRH